MQEVIWGKMKSWKCLTASETQKQPCASVERNCAYTEIQLSWQKNIQKNHTEKNKMSFGELFPGRLGKHCQIKMWGTDGAQQVCVKVCILIQLDLFFHWIVTEDKLSRDLSWFHFFTLQKRGQVFQWGLSCVSLRCRLTALFKKSNWLLWVNLPAAAGWCTSSTRGTVGGREWLRGRSRNTSQRGQSCSGRPRNMLRRDVNLFICSNH